ncbi:hypothetical protein C882_4109 [Caenispirillum salinarum AK4]|uniref:DUF2155 domain-containing protein n=1 Tax=Caenispirillum salinarum AK4 TaxID=1238182 RepID=K9GZQ2_9PROT|nr:hypothetical protein C882_4109 [Caenispirillum salinarum AK4]
MTPDEFVPQQVAVLGALDKITARERELIIPVGTSDQFQGLAVMVRTCQRTTVSTTPQSAAFLEISDESVIKRGRRPTDGASASGDVPAPEQVSTDDSPDAPPHLFTGWMFSASPSVSAMEHPVYDIVLKGCRASAPQVAVAPLPTRKHGVRSAAVPLPGLKPATPADPTMTQTAQRPEETG